MTDLKAGMLVTTSDGQSYIVVKGTCGPDVLYSPLSKLRPILFFSNQVTFTSTPYGQTVQRKGVLSSASRILHLPSMNWKNAMALFVVRGLFQTLMNILNPSNSFVKDSRSLPNI